MKKIKFDNKGNLIPQKVNYKVEHDEETTDLLKKRKYINMQKPIGREK